MPKSFLIFGFLLILLAIGLGSWATISAIERVVPRLHPTVKVQMAQVTLHLSVTCPCGTVIPFDVTIDTEWPQTEQDRVIAEATQAALRSCFSMSATLEKFKAANKERWEAAASKPR